MELILLEANNSVEFPRLGLYMEHLPEGFWIRDMFISYYGMFLAVAFICGLLVIEAYAKKTEQKPEQYLDLSIRVLFTGVAGARVAFLLSHLNYYMEQPKQIFTLNSGGLSFYGALFAGIVTCIVFCRKRELDFYCTVDTMTVGILTGQIIGRCGDFFSRDTLGKATEGFFSMKLAVTEQMSSRNAELVNNINDLPFTEQSFLQIHPVFLYQILLELGLVWVLVVISKKKRFQGQLFGIYLFGYGGIRFFLEFFRMNRIVLSGRGITLGHIISLFVMLAGYILLEKKSDKKKKPLPPEII